MLAELLALRPLGVEPVENVLELCLGDARPLVLDRDLHHPARPRAPHSPMRPSPGEKDCALPIRLRSTCTSRPSTACTTQRPPAASARGAARLRRASSRGSRPAWRGSAPHRPARCASRDSSASMREASLMSLISRSSRATSSAMMAEQAALLDRVVDAPQRLDGAADRGQRVLDLVRDVGGEALDRVHAVPQRARRLRQRGGEFADLVAARSAARPAPCRRGRGPRASARRRRASRRIGRAMVSDRYHDSITVSASASANSARIDTRTANRLSSTSRASRVSSTMPTVWRLRSTGSDTVTSSRSSAVRRI